MSVNLPYQFTFLGTGTSQGVPVIGSTHPVCLSDNPKDKRTRSSALVEGNDTSILIDCGPDFRHQMLSHKKSSVDAVFLTHEHNDHVLGLDDLRPIIFEKNEPINIYALPRVLDEIKLRFPYAFQDHKYPGVPSFNLIPINNPVDINGITITPINIYHGNLPIYGYKIKELVYITDANQIPENQDYLLENLDVLILNSLRADNPHYSHFVLEESLAVIEKFKPKKAYLTHISHLMGFHDEVNQTLPPHVELAYDGLSFEF